MHEYSSERLVKKLKGRRGGRFHAFSPIAADRAALIVIDFTEASLPHLPNEETVKQAIKALTVAARLKAIPIHWIVPEPVEKWRSHVRAKALPGDVYKEGSPE